MIIVDDPNFLDVLVSQLAQVRNIMESVYDTLTYLDVADPTFAIKGRLAKEEFPEDLIMELQPPKESHFYNGEDFTAEDVNGHRIRQQELYTGSLHGFLEPVDLVVVSMRHRYGSIAAQDAVGDCFDLISSTYIRNRRHQTDCRYAERGTGLYFRKNGCRVTMTTSTKNPNYWIEGQPDLDELAFRHQRAISLPVMPRIYALALRSELKERRCSIVIRATPAPDPVADER